MSMSKVIVDHDNGNHVCLSQDGKSVGTYVRQDQMFYMPDGEPLPLIGALLCALDLHDRAVFA